MQSKNHAQKHISAHRSNKNSTDDTPETMEILLNPNTKMTHKNADGNVRWAREKLNQSNVNTFVTAASEVWYAQRQYYYGKYNSKINN